MKSISSGLAAHLAGEVTTLATCWKLTRTDAVVLGFTDHDKDLVVEGVTYIAASGFTSSAIANSAKLSVDNLDIEGILDADAITEADIMAGRYDLAEIEVFLVNYEDISQGKLYLRSGWLGEVTVKNGRFVTELRGLSQKLAQTIGELYSPLCRAALGDAKCQVNLASYTVTGTITSVAGQGDFTDSGRGEASGFFTFGKLTFTSGANDGLSMEVKEFQAGGRFLLALPMSYEVAAGDTYSVYRGCDKTFSACKNIFNNAVNFRGEPHVPGIDRMLETAGTKSDW